MDREALRSQAAGRRNYVDLTAPKVAFNTCVFCGHAFSERVYMNHSCPERKRNEELQSVIGQAAYSYYSKWMQLKKRPAPSIETFGTSRLYSTFVKFAKHVQRVHMPTPLSFIRAMVNENIQPALFCRDNVYSLYLQLYDEVVPPMQQFIDSYDTIITLAKERECDPRAIFQTIGVSDVLDLVQKRKLSPWFLVSSRKFREFMQVQNEIDKDRLETAVQVGAMIMRIQQSPENIELFKLFSEATTKEDL